MADENGGVVTAWTGVWVTLLMSCLQSVVFYGFFKYQRNKEIAKSSYDLYEPRQHTRSHRSPAAFASCWWKEAWNLSDEETLRCIGLDSFMFLRLLRLGARICAVGTVLSLVLIPVYATGRARGVDTEKFNQWTLARVDSSSHRIWAALGAWWVFINFILSEIQVEWKLYAKNRQVYMAKGDPDTPQEYRYAVIVEQIPTGRQETLKTYFGKMFPSKIQNVEPCLDVEQLQKLIHQRKGYILKLESAIAFTKAKPTKPRPKFKKQDAIEFYEKEIDRLNNEIDDLREQVTYQDVSSPTKSASPRRKPFSSTAFVTFSSLQAKQMAIQCELNGDPKSMNVFPASDPKSMLWDNVAVPLPKQRLAQLKASLLWTAGIMFWAFPVLFVTSISNLNSILEAIGATPADPSVFWYGLVSGLLPVIALAVLMIVLYMAIQACATSFVRLKSWPEVDTYTLYWHQLFQFANLWLILIGGSFFNQVDAILEEPESIVNIIASALPAASTFFVNMIIVSSFGNFGLELSMLPTYGVKLIMSLISPEEMKTQRQIDAAKECPSLVWGKIVPKVIFIFLVSVMYMPIVPIMEIFGLAYFAGMYLVCKHQCLHVYSQRFEGGGDATWRQVFGFLMACIYMAEVVFIAYMGIKEAPMQGILGFVPLVITFGVHQELKRNIIQPLQNLPLELAERIDSDEGDFVLSSTPLLNSGEELVELDIEGGGVSQSTAIVQSNLPVKSLYKQPALDTTQEERAPLPYRRDQESAEKKDKSSSSAGDEQDEVEA